MSRREQVLDVLDSWRFWVGVAYFGLVAVVIGLWIVNSNTVKNEAVRRVDRQALAIAVVLNCQQEAKRRGQFSTLLPPFGQLLREHDLATPATVKAALELISDTPTMADCVVLAQRLRITPDMLTIR